MNRNSLSRIISLAAALFVATACLTVEGAPRTFRPRNGDELQKAIHDATYGDTILLEPGAIYRQSGWGKSIVLENHGDNPGGLWITIQSSALEKLPAGKRVAPAQAKWMPTIVSSGMGASAISTEASAHHYKLLGIEVAMGNCPGYNPMSSDTYELISLGRYDQTSLAQVPHDLVFDRCYIHGQPDWNLVNGVVLQSSFTTVSNSYISDVHRQSNESHGICSYNGPGPFTIDNNLIEAATENILVGGADPAIPNLIPKGFQITNNDFNKPLSWDRADPRFTGIAGDKTRGWVIRRSQVSNAIEARENEPRELL